MESPDFASGAFFPAFGNTPLGNIVIVNDEQTLIKDIVDRKNIPLLRFERTNRERLGALDADRDAGAYILRACCVNWQDQQDQQDQA